jgi:radical SAM protein with 4Fe4S-binding SPASM domain
LGIRTQFLTNGLSLHPANLDSMAESGVRAFGVSLDGLEATHEVIRGHRGLFRAVVAGVERALARGFTVTVITTVTTLNLDELPALATLLADLGVQHWQVQPIFPLGRAREHTGLELEPDAYLRLGRFVRDQEDEARRRGLEIMPSDPFGYYTDLDNRRVPWRGCPAGRAACGITSDGKVKGCLSLPDAFVEGDLRRRDLWSIWFDPASFEYNRRFDLGALGANCRGCALAEQCMGGCAAMSCGSTGAFHDDPLCFHGILSRAAARPSAPVPS